MKQQITRFFAIPAVAAAVFIALFVSACVSAGNDASITPDAPAQTVASIDESAQTAYAAEDWDAVAKLYGTLTAQQPTNGRYWYRLAVGLRYIGKFDAAGKALDEAALHQVPAYYIDYERAKIAATQHQAARAIELLQSAATGGLAGKEFVFDNEHLAALAGEPGIDAVIDQLEANKYPCRDARFHEFDFWVGNWQVTDANGQLQGSNKISAREKHCLLLEEWTSASGGTGTSINYFDLAAEKWVQQWISPGAQIHIEGGMVDGSMVLEGFIYYPQAKNRADFRGTWTPLIDGRVRQFFEQANAEGVWTPWFEGFYTRAESMD